MNDDDDWYTVVRDYRSWTDYPATRLNPSLTSEEIYNLLKGIDLPNTKDTAMAYSNSYTTNTHSDEVATAVLEAYANGVDFDTLIKKNRIVRQYWAEIQRAKAIRSSALEKENARLAKRAARDAAKQEVMTKLSTEELEAFGLIRKGKR